jgi:hypothetical protein
MDATAKIIIAVVVVLVLLLVVFYAWHNCHLGKWSHKKTCSDGFCSDPPDPRAGAQYQAVQQANGGTPTSAPPCDDDDPLRGDGNEMFVHLQGRNHARRRQLKSEKFKQGRKENLGFVDARKARFASVRGVDQFTSSGTDHFGGPEEGGHGHYEPNETPDHQARHFTESTSTCMDKCTDGCNGSACDAQCTEKCQDISRNIGLVGKAHSSAAFGFRT